MPRDWSKCIDERLNGWAEWFIRDSEYGVGYPRASLLARWQEGWTLLNQPIGKRPLPSNQAAEEIERLVVEMFQHNKKMALTLRAHYFIQGSTRTKAARFQLSHSSFCAHVALAKEWLIGRLSGE